MIPALSLHLLLLSQFQLSSQKTLKLSLPLSSYQGPPLTSYLGYAEEQLKQNFEWLQKALKHYGSRHELPWRRIDDSNVKTEGFLRQSFEFTLDNAKILDLLTGHTLYNDTSVVLRELVQNSLDAVRLQGYLEKRKFNSNYKGRVVIRWDSKNRLLSVLDNGTGMTQRIIEDNLLKVGASRYQDQEFQKEYPEFSSISRFGIGILSAFMIADEVEVITCHPDDEKARQLTLRSVHGKYLIRLLDKETIDEGEIAPNGTIIRIKVRASTKRFDVLTNARNWIIVPGCDVSVQMDDGDPLQIGYVSPKVALTELLRDYDVVIDDGSSQISGRRVRIIEKEANDVTVAFAVEWSEYFENWTFLNIDYLQWRARQQDLRTKSLMTGTCVEGIRVEVGSPGFAESGFLSIANAVGRNAPKTNVARSGLELTPERDKLLETVYGIYCSHVEEEFKKLSSEREFSLTWSVREARYLLNAILGYNSRRIQDVDLMIKSAMNLPIFLVEKNGKRNAISATQLAKHERFWTVDGAFFSSAEDLIREVDSNASLSGVIEALNVSSLKLPNELVLSAINRVSMLDNYALRQWEVDTVRIDRKHRRVDLGWSPIGTDSRWCFLSYEDIRSVVSNISVESMARVYNYSLTSKDTALALRSDLVVAKESVSVEGVTDEAAVFVGGLNYVLPNSDIGKYLRIWFDKTKDDADGKIIHLTLLLLVIVQQALNDRSGTTIGNTRVRRSRNIDDINIVKSDKGMTGEQVLRMLESLGLSRPPEEFDANEFSSLLRTSKTRVFDPYAWRRSGEGIET